MQNPASAQEFAAEHIENGEQPVVEHFVDTEHLPQPDIKDVEGMGMDSPVVEQAANNEEAAATEAASSSIYEQLLECARAFDANFLPRGGKEPLDVFAKRLVDAVSKAPIEAWEALPTPAQLWYDNSCKAQAEAQPYPEIPGLVLDEPKKARGRPAKSKAADYVDAKDAKDTHAKTKALKKAVKEAKPKLPARPARPAGYRSTVSIIREFVCMNYDATTTDIQAMLQARGLEVKPVTLVAVRTDTRSTIKVAKELGRWKEDSPIPLETRA